MTSFRATSSPLRSSRGSGSVYPAERAESTAVDHVPPLDEEEEEGEGEAGKKLLKR